MRYRAFVIPALGLVLILGGFLVFGSLGDNLIYYRTPTEVLEEPTSTERLRLGGQVADGTVTSDETSVTFTITDGIESVVVVHEGAPQQLFQEGIGVVVEGAFEGDVFHSDTMIIKHDEQYRTEDGTVYKTPSS